MPDNRLSDFIVINKNEIEAIFWRYNDKLRILDFSLIDNSMSNTCYEVITTSEKYLLKLYSNTTDKIETAVYSYLKGKINVPELYYYDSSKQYFRYVYTITEYLESSNLKNFILSNHEYKSSTAGEIGKMLGILHKRKYRSDAWLDENLNERDIVLPTHEHIMNLLNDKAGTYLKADTVAKVIKFIKRNPNLFERISAESVLSHGDINYSNILIAYNKVYFIDFEFAHVGSMYHDIGKFFRTKSQYVQSLIDTKLYCAFADGYNSVSSSQLPVDWLRLAHLCDIDSMLVLINRDNTPAEWILDIEHDILCAIDE